VPPDDDGWGDWTIGAIVGPSGSGKSVVARQAYQQNLIERHTWPRNKPMIDAIAPGSVELKQVADLLNAFGNYAAPTLIDAVCTTIEPISLPMDSRLMSDIAERDGITRAELMDILDTDEPMLLISFDLAE
jgi:hypothetical protein